MIRFYQRFFAPAIFLSVLLAWGLPNSAVQAQINPEPFGKNRIQYKKFNWKYVSTQNFNVYYYDGGKTTALLAADYAEKELKRITSIIGYFPYAKTTLILYSSVADLRQSNIGLNEDMYQTGGESLFLKNKIELAFEGAQTEFKKNLSLQVSRLLLNDMMYGGSLKEVLQSSYMLQLPDWFLNGAAAYIAEGWNVEMDNFMRDMVLKNRNKKAEVIFSRNQQLAGQSVWNYISERYGYTSIQNILNLTRITRDIEVGIASSLNVSYKKFIRDWQQHYLQMNTFSESEGLVSLPEKNQLFRKNRRSYLFTQPTFSPDGRKLAYVENDRGSYEIKVMDIARRNIRTIRKGGNKTPDQRIDLKTPILAWKSPNQLNIIEIKRAKSLAVTHYFNRGNNTFINNLKTAIFGGQPGVLGQFSQVLNINYSEDGKMMVMAAVKNGQSDLFLFQGNSRQPFQLTDDVYDEKNVSFLKGQKAIVFSSNRWLDTAGIATLKLDKIADNYDLFRLDLDQTGSAPRRVVATISNELAPISEDAENILYMGEESGIRSIYRYNLVSGQKQKITSFLQNIKAFDYDPVNRSLALISADQNREFVYYLPGFTPAVASTTFKTVRQTTLEDRTLRPVNRQPIVTPAPEADASPDTLASAPKDKTINIRNYEFEPERNTTPTPRANTVVATPAASTNATAISVPYNYDLRFSMGKLVSSFYQDNLMGLGLLAEVGMEDMFEDHRITGGAFFKTDLSSSNFYAVYTNLKKRYDLDISFRKQTLQYKPSSDIILRYARQEFTPAVSYPLSHTISVRVLPKVVHTRYSSLGLYNLPEGDSVDFFGGGGAELVFDNSVSTGVNMSEGTRLKAGISTFKELNDSRKNFSKIYLDLRHYQKVHRQIIWANRLSYGHFYGNDPKRFMLGGVNNWLFNREDGDNSPVFDNQTRPADLFYQEFATPMRGFKFNARNGNKYLLFNSELRIPVVQYLFQNSTLGSGFFRNFMLTAFSDIGSAYNGASPFSRKNSYNTQVIGGGLDPSDPNYDPNNTNAFQAIVVNYRNPFLFGYGVGARTTLLGLYGKFDVAWGEENFERKGPQLYLSLGYDF